MNWDGVAQILQDLPDTFRRQGDVFAAWEKSQIAALSRYTTASDAQLAALNFNTVKAHWLDTWGRLFGVPRFAGELDDNYRSRIKATLVAARGTPVAINRGIGLAGLGPTTVMEALPSVGYTVALSTQVGANSRPGVVRAMLPVRPAGVPFTFGISRGGLYLSTINFFGRSRMTGAYLVRPTTAVNPTLPASTNNAQPLLPTVFLSDTTINPNL